MSIFRSFSVILSLVLGIAPMCRSADITYDVNLTIGVSATVTGEIVTDGTIGALGPDSVLDWNLLLNDGTSTFDLLGPLSGANSSIGFGDSFDTGAGVNWTATATQMLYNYSAGDDSWLYFDNSTENNIVDFSTADIEGYSYAELLRVNNGPFYSTSLSGIQVLGTASSSSSAPEPSTLVLLTAGFVFLGFRKASALSPVAGAASAPHP